jgi:hypothetical protein
MRAVRIEEAATVRAQLFDNLLRSRRPLRDHLLTHRLHHRFAVRPIHGLAISASCGVWYGSSTCTVS